MYDTNTEAGNRRLFQVLLPTRRPSSNRHQVLARPWGRQGLGGGGVGGGGGGRGAGSTFGSGDANVPDRKERKKPPGGRGPPVDPEGVRDSSFSESETDSEPEPAKRLAKRRKEHDEFKHNSIPKANQYRAWRGCMYTTTNKAANRGDDQALRWMLEADYIVASQHGRNIT